MLINTSGWLGMTYTLEVEHGTEYTTILAKVMLNDIELAFRSAALKGLSEGSSPAEIEGKALEFLGSDRDLYGTALSELEVVIGRQNDLIALHSTYRPFYTPSESRRRIKKLKRDLAALMSLKKRNTDLGKLKNWRF